jgi:NADH:ubiquinone oxidoreductase subunit 6 (subunit J)
MKLDTLLLIFTLLCIAIYTIFIAADFIAMLPWGIIGLGVIGIFAFIVYKVGMDRLRNAEDDYYEKNIHK